MAGGRSQPDRIGGVQPYATQPTARAIRLDSAEPVWFRQATDIREIQDKGDHTRTAAHA